MSMMSTLMTVMRKELRDLSRDRRTLLLTLLFGPLLYPVLLLGMGKLAESRVRTDRSAVADSHHRCGERTQPGALPRCTGPQCRAGTEGPGRGHPQPGHRCSAAHQR